MLFTSFIIDQGENPFLSSESHERKHRTSLRQFYSSCQGMIPQLPSICKDYFLKIHNILCPHMLSPRGDCRGGCCHHIFVFFPHFYEKTSKGDIRKNSWDALYLQFLRRDEIQCNWFCGDDEMHIWRFYAVCTRIFLLPSDFRLNKPFIVTTSGSVADTG